jgi:hypothetical protein
VSRFFKNKKIVSKGIEGFALCCVPWSMQTRDLYPVLSDAVVKGGEGDPAQAASKWRD